MTPDRMAALVARWVRLYTRKLPAPVAERRIDEIEADLHDHIEHERACGSSDRRIALGIASRMVRGLAADTSWRRRHAEATAYRSAVRILLATALVLLVPMVAMLIGDDVAWGPVDFAIVGALVVAIGVVREVTVRKAGDRAYRVAVGVAVGAALLLVWMSLALGIVGEDGDPADLMYAGVLAVGIVGAVGARFRPSGMANALLATAAAQALVAVIALIAGKHETPISSVGEIVGLNAIFVALFLASAWLFRRAARTTPAASLERG